MRVCALYWAQLIPGIQVYLFRRTNPDLIKNHLNGAGSFYELLAPYIQSGDVTITTQPAEVKFSNGSKIHLCHCQHEKDIYNYQGAEINMLLIDELTHFSEAQYRFLRGRVRIGGLKIPDDIKGMLPRILNGSNPGGVGHSWVKRTFIDMVTPYEVKEMKDSEGGFTRQFIPALLEDNPTMLENDPGYEKALEGLGSPDLVRALRYGDWDITAGSAFEKLRRDKHMIRNFKVPPHWTKFTVIDWGTARPFAVCWFTVCEDNTILAAKEEWKEMILPRGALVMYREYYGWNGKPNEGCRMESFEVAREIMDIEEKANEEMDYRVGDSSMWAQVDGPSVQERMYDATEGGYSMQKSKKDRISNYQEVRARIVGEDEDPMFFTTENCKHFWRTMPDLQLDELHPEKGYDTDQEDHIADCVAYACASRPYITTEHDRVEDEWEETRKYRKKQGKGYGTK